MFRKQKRHREIRCKVCQKGWRNLLTRASFRKTPRNGKSYFTRRSLCINNASAKERGIAMNLLLAFRNVMYQQQVDLVVGDFGGLHGAASRAAILDSSAVLKNRSSIRSYHCHLAPHRCGGQEACQASGLMFVGSSNRRVPKMNGKSVCMEPSLSLTAFWVSRKQIKVATTKFGSTTSTPTRGRSIAYPGKTNIVDQYQGRGTSRTTTARKGGRIVSREWYMSSV